MLNELLRLLNDGGIHSTAELARRLGVSEQLVAAMTADLARRGYLAPVEGGCDTSCDGCGAAKMCAPTALLALTSKGRQIAAARPTS